MRTFGKLVKINMQEELSYKSAFISGIICQFAFGFMNVILYCAYFESGSVQPLTLSQTVSYIWLQQAFFAIFCYSDTNRVKITKKILSGDVAYQLLKPINLYDYWYFDTVGRTLAMVSLRFLPIIAVSAILPAPFNLSLPISVCGFVLFLVSLAIGTFLVVAIKMFAYLAVLYTMDAKGVFALTMSVCSLLAGAVVPIPLMPDVLQKILNFLPFRYASDLPYRIYIGSINTTDALVQIGIQIFWLAFMIALGRVLLTHKSKKLVVQGG